MGAFPWLPIVTVIAALPPAILASLVWQERGEPGAKPFFAMLVGAVGFDLLYAASMVVWNPRVNWFLFSLLAAVLLAISVLWLLFVLEYTGRVKFVSVRLVVGLLSLPTVAFAFLLGSFRTGPFVEEYALVERAGAVVTSVEFTSLGAAVLLLGTASLVVGLAMLFTFVVSDGHRYGRQTIVLVIAGALPAGTSLVRGSELIPLAPVNLTPFAWAIGSTVVGFGLLRWDIFGFAPATLRVGHAAAIDDLGDAVVIVEADYRIVDANDRAVRLLGQDAHDLVQTPISVAIGEPIDPEEPGTVRLVTERGQRDFDLSASAIDGPWGQTIGYTLVFHDVTPEKQRRQRLEVLNRVLRHNLRNSMNAIVGFSRELEDHVADSGEWMLDRIEAQSADLVDLSEKAREIDRVTSPSRPASRFSVEAAMENVRNRLLEDEDALAVTVSVPAGLQVSSNEVVFESVLQYAARSLVSHNGPRDLRLVLSATPADDERPWLTCTVTSNAEPIPVAERQVIERGEETPLEHSDDLDLWLVSWGVETLGGDLAFLNDDDRPGIRLSVPDLRAETDGRDGDDETV